MQSLAWPASSGPGARGPSPQPAPRGASACSLRSKPGGRPASEHPGDGASAPPTPPHSAPCGVPAAGSRPARPAAPVPAGVGGAPRPEEARPGFGLPGPPPAGRRRAQRCANAGIGAETRVSAPPSTLYLSPSHPWTPLTFVGGGTVSPRRGRACHVALPPEPRQKQALGRTRLVNARVSASHRVWDVGGVCAFTQQTPDASCSEPGAGQTPAVRPHGRKSCLQRGGDAGHWNQVIVMCRQRIQRRGRGTPSPYCKGVWRRWSPKASFKGCVGKKQEKTMSSGD